MEDSWQAIHPFITLSTLYLNSIRSRWGNTPWTGLQSLTCYTLTSGGSLDPPLDLNIHVFRLWEKLYTERPLIWPGFIPRTFLVQYEATVLPWLLTIWRKNWFHSFVTSSPLLLLSCVCIINWLCQIAPKHTQKREGGGAWFWWANTLIAWSRRGTSVTTELSHLTCLYTCVCVHTQTQAGFTDTAWSGSLVLVN